MTERRERCDRRRVDNVSRSIVQCIVDVDMRYTLAAEGDAVREASAYAAMHLSSILRRSGESYAAHGEELAGVLKEVTSDAALHAVAILHDLPEHPSGKTLLQTAPLTEDQRTLVHGMRTLRRLHIDENTTDLDTVLDAFAEEPRLLVLRMAHRLNDVRHLERFSREAQRRIAHETLHLYTAIAGRLGFHRWRWQMEDICFTRLHPRLAARIRKEFTLSQETDRACLGHTRTYLLKKLQDAGIEAEMDERIKGVYSTYRKMLLKKRSFSELTDRLALRIIVPQPEQCYLALGIVHAHMHPMPGKLKDYIGAPKENGYRSLHTVVYPLPGVSELPIEIQIRTREMHEECEFGIASHADYKQLRYALTSAASRANLFRNLRSLRDSAASPARFEKALRTHFREDHLLLFNPQNRFFHLRKPATAMDFACQEMPGECARVTGVRINGRDKPLDTPLKDGDTVELLLGSATESMKRQLDACVQKSSRKLIEECWLQAKAQEQVSETRSFTYEI